MGSRVQLCVRKDQHPHNTRPKMVPFSYVLSFYDDSGLNILFSYESEWIQNLCHQKPLNYPEYFRDGLGVFVILRDYLKWLLNIIRICHWRIQFIFIYHWEN